MCKKSPVCWPLEFDLCHISARLIKSAIFAPILTFFFLPDLSKMQIRTFNKQKINK